MSERGFSDPPPSIVENGAWVLGRFSAAPGRINLLDVQFPYYFALPRFIKNWRLKEWAAFQFGNKRYFMFAALYNAKVFGQVLFLGWDRESKRRFGFKRMFPGPLSRPTDTFDKSHVSWKGYGVSMSYAVDLETGIIGFDMEHPSRKKANRLAASFHFSINPKQTASQSVCLPFTLNRAMYSTKTLMPMSGSLDLHGETIEFKAADCMGIMDDHKGLYPYHMRYDWLTAFGLDAKDRRVGFNLTDNQVRDQESYNENCLWINGRIYALPPIRITRPKGIDGDWIVQDTEGMVDLIFKPELHQRMKINMGIVRSDYDGPFGTFKGFIKSPDGERIYADLLYGMGEKKILQI